MFFQQAVIGLQGGQVDKQHAGGFCWEVAWEALTPICWRDCQFGSLPAEIILGVPACEIAACSCRSG